jgi:hypothetical protein
VPLITLGLVTAAIGSAATSLLLAAISARSVNSGTWGLLVCVLLGALILRVVFMHVWQLRRADRRLRRETRQSLDAALAAGQSPDIPTLCWCIAIAAGCSNSDARPLTLRRLEEVESRLGVRLPRRWVFDPNLRKAIAMPTGARPLPAGDYRVARPWRLHRIAADALAVAVVLGALPWALAGLLARAGPGGPHPALVLALMGVGIALMLGIRACAARYDLRLRVTRSGEAFLRTRVSATAPAVTFDPDGFQITFLRDDGSHRAFRVGRGAPDERARLLAHAPWTTVEISLTRQRPMILGLEL